MEITKIIAQELNIKITQVTKTIELLDEGNTIPFIARYRKEATGGLSDETLREFGERLTYLRNLETRKEEVKSSIEKQEKLTEEIEKSLEEAMTLAEVEDIYRPYKQKKKTRATIAKAKGLEPLANIILKQKDTRLIEEIAMEYVTDEKTIDENTKKEQIVQSVEEAIQGAKDIIAEIISDNPKYRKQIKRRCYREGFIITIGVKQEEKTAYDMYYEFRENISKIPSHRILAINRGEKEECLKVKLDKNEENILNYIKYDLIKR